MEHVLLQIKVTDDGRSLKEPVHADKLENGCYRLLYSPGLVLGIAAGDEFTVDPGSGAFQVVKRSGNLAIQIFADSIAPHLQELEKIARSLGGVLDGSIEQGAVLTIPVNASFPVIEKVLTDYCAANEGVEWYYGNVYSPVDGITPLGWWEEI